MPRILLTAIGSMSASAVIAALRAIPDAYIAGCDIHPGDWLESATLVDDFAQVPLAADAPAYLAALRDLCARHAITHVIPLTDPEVDLLSEHGLPGACVCASPAPVVRALRDKLHWAQALANQDGLPAIPTAALEDAPPEWAFPLAAKPRLGRSRIGFHRLDSCDDLAWLSSRTEPGSYVLQPFLAGTVVVVDVVRDPRTGDCAAMCREELIRTSNGAGISVAMMPSPELEGRAARIAGLFGLHGCANLEFMRTQTDFLLMDINPRFSAGIGFSAQAGYDMVGNHLNVFMRRPIAARPDYSRAIITRCSGNLMTLSSHE